MSSPSRSALRRTLAGGRGGRAVPVLVAVFGLGVLLAGVFRADAAGGFPVGIAAPADAQPARHAPPADLRYRLRLPRGRHGRHWRSGTRRSTARGCAASGGRGRAARRVRDDRVGTRPAGVAAFTTAIVTALDLAEPARRGHLPRATSSAAEPRPVPGILHRHPKEPRDALRQHSARSPTSPALPRRPPSWRRSSRSAPKPPRSGALLDIARPHAGRRRRRPRQPGRRRPRPSPTARSPRPRS